MTRVLEFYGIPGSGKSTISHMVANQLRERGLNVSEPTYHTDNECSVPMRKLVKALGLIRYMLLHPIKYCTLIRIINENGIGGIRAISHSSNITVKLWEYEHSKADYVLFDEGLVQSAVSLSSGVVSASENENRLFRLIKLPEVIRIHIVVSSETALNRLINRPRHDSSIEKIDGDEKKLEALNVYREKCNLISSDMVVENLTESESADVIIRQLL